MKRNIAGETRITKGTDEKNRSKIKGSASKYPISIKQHD
jgi:hypothetical protein